MVTPPTLPTQQSPLPDQPKDVFIDSAAMLFFIVVMFVAALFAVGAILMVYFYFPR